MISKTLLVKGLTLASLTLSSIFASGVTLETLHTFEGSIKSPRFLVRLSNGDLYGSAGDPDDANDLFRLYQGSTNGPWQLEWKNIRFINGILEASDGALYLTTMHSVDYPNGAILKLQGTNVSTLYSFSGTGLRQPTGSLIEASDGNFYGTTGSFDGSNHGSIFRITPSGVFTTLHVFDWTNGSNPQGGLIQASDGCLYGTTYDGGILIPNYGGGGTVFKITTNGVFTTLHQFDVAGGVNPRAGVIEGEDGNFYGTTEYGGDTGYFFGMTPGGTITTMSPFSPNLVVGRQPHHRLVEGTNGAFYGVTSRGGLGNGAAYKVTSSGDITLLHSFEGENWGMPIAGLVLDNDGYFYGTTPESQVYSNDTEVIFNGTVFRFNEPQNSDYPSIQRQPTGGTYPFSTGIHLSVIASGRPPFGYQWQKDGSPINGATGPILSIGAAVLTNSGDYTVIVTNSLGAITSAVAVVTVIDPGIVYQPESHSAPVSGQTTFHVEARGTGSLSYQWKKDGTNLLNGATVSGAQSATLSLGNLSAADAGNYYVSVSNSAGSIESSPAMLTILDPAIISPPTWRVASFGQSISFTVGAVGSSTLSYQWARNGTNLTDGGKISGSSTATLAISNVSSADAGYYTVTVSNTVGSTQAETRLMVNDPVVINNPQSVTAAEGTSASFTVEAAGSSALSYQWRKSGTATNLVDGGRISGATTATLTISELTLDDTGFYYVDITSTNGSASGSAQLTVTTLPAITAQPTSKIAAWGMSTSFSVSVAGTGPFTYEWTKDGVPVVDGPKVSGATTSTLTLSGVTTDDAGSYSVVVSNGSGSTASSAAVLTVTITTSILAQPANQTNLTGSTATFTVNATSDATLHYRWIKGTIQNNSHSGVQLNEGSKYSGTQSDTLTIHNVDFSDAGTYFVLIGTTSSNMYFAPTWPGTARSDVAELTVLNSPVIGQHPANTLVLVGSNATLAVTVPGGGALGFQWRKDGTPLANQTTATLTLNNAQLTDTGIYDVVIAGVDASVTSNPAKVTVLRQVALYNGLFHEADAIRHETAGFLTLKTSRTNFSGKIILEGLASSFTGKLSSDGTGTKTIIRTNLARENLTLLFTIDPSNEQITGTISNSQWSTALLADYYPYSLTNTATNFAGYYTLALPGFVDGSEGPVGSSCASILVNALGKQTLAGALADGQILKSAVQLSAKGTAPIYSPAYVVGVTNHLGRIRKEFRGSAMGWLTITNNAPQGTLSWIKTGWTNALYDTGFTNEGVVLSSRHIYTPGTRVMQMTNGLLTFSGGNLAESFSANVLLKTNNVLSATLPQTNKAVVSLAPKTGLYSGSFRHPENTNIVTKFRGVILQQQNYGTGFFAGTNHNGATIIAPQ